jgi:hypothetical protein
MEYEIIGTIASIVIMLAFILNGEKKIRIVDLIGAILFIVYGVLIKSFSVVFLNGCLTLVQIYKLYKLRK